MFPVKPWILTLICIFSLPGLCAATERELLNVSYDPTREFYEEYNAMFARHWKEQSGESISVLQSHGGSGKQARAVIEGLKADVVTLALAYDIDAIARRGKLLPADWQSRLPNNSAPYTSTILFVVRPGNPKHIRDWDDLARSDVKVVMPSPKTSGGARWNYLAAWAYGLKRFDGDEEKTRDFVAKIYRNAPVLDAGARAATTTFIRRGMGDVLICWENEAHLAIREMRQMRRDKKEEGQIVIPSISIRAEPPVAVIDRNAKRKGNEAAAQEYLRYLYEPQAQELAAKYFLRPSDERLAAKYFPVVETVSVDELGGWKEVQKKHFDEGGIFDQFYQNR